jgi:hypothetical protein
MSNDIHKISIEIAEHELTDYVARLKANPDEALGFVTALATDFRRNYLAEKGVDLLDPGAAYDNDPALAEKLGAEVRNLQYSGDFERKRAGAIIIWVHTIRAVAEPSLHQLALEMWREFSRGFPYVEMAAETLEEALAYAPSIHGAATFPVGFDPSASS